jgi:NAD(P)-dependent dehydrogenase (short-subunit alcohol dehydrogenase family)
MTPLMHGSAGRAALVTGGTRGIGRGIVRKLIAAGVRVATVYHEDESAARALIREGDDAGVRPLVARINIAEFAPLEAFVNKTLETFGRLDYLVNNVGVNIFKPIRDLTFEEWRQSQDLILNAAFCLCRLALAPMRAQSFGRIVNIGASSKDYLHGHAGMGAFGVHKAALTVLTKTLAVEEIAHGITVNMVAPGSTRDAGTIPESQRIPISHIPLGRRVEVEEIAAAVMFFLSDHAASVTGQCLAVNGGMST